MPDWLTPEIRTQLLDGALLTVAITAITSVAAMLIGVAAGVARLSDRRPTRLLVARRELGV